MWLSSSKTSARSAPSVVLMRSQSSCSWAFPLFGSVLTASFHIDTGASDRWRSYRPSLTSSLRPGVVLIAEFLGEAESSTEFEQVFEAPPLGVCRGGASRGSPGKGVWLLVFLDHLIVEIFKARGVKGRQSFEFAGHRWVTAHQLLHRDILSFIFCKTQISLST